jgi:hypothetical protein
LMFPRIQLWRRPLAALGQRAGAQSESRFAFAAAYAKVKPRVVWGAIMGGAIAALAAAAIAAVPALAGAAELSLTSGVGYATGGYGSTRTTDSLLVPLAAKLRAGSWTFGVSSEWVSVNGPADIVDIDEAGGAGLVPAKGGKRDRQGFTDTTISARYAFDHIGGGPLYVDVQAKAGLAVASDGFNDSRRLADVEVGGEWRSMGVYFDLGRRFLGDGPTVDRHDAWAYAIGGWARFDRHTEIGMWFVTHDAPVLGEPAARKLGAYVSRDLRPNLKLAVTLYEGLSPASPDFGGGLRLMWRPGSDFRRRPFDE